MQVQMGTFENRKGFTACFMLEIAKVKHSNKPLGWV